MNYSRRTLTLVGAVIALAVGAGIAVAFRPAATAPSASPSPSPSEQWPPLMTAYDNNPVPALTAAWAWCHGMGIKHDWLAFADMSYGEGRETLIVEQRTLEWIEGYFGHPIDTGTKASTYDLDWIEEYLGHPLPDGYYLWAAQTCVLEFLGAPPSILDDMLATRTEDGTRTATWSDFEATWTNDGENGPDVVFSYHRP